MQDSDQRESIFDCACPNDGVQIPQVGQFGAGSTLVRFYWCWSCQELFAHVGERGTLAATFAQDASRQWQVLKVLGSEPEKEIALAAVSKVDPKQLPNRTT